MMKKILALSAALAGSVSSFAAGVDVTAAVTSIADQAAPIALVGGAVFLVYVGIKGFKWVRKAL